MLERFIQDLRTDDPGAEEPAATRARLKPGFAPGAARRMTLLGMLVGAALGDLRPAEDDTVVYASTFGESRALEAFLDSFPDASPTQFQTSIHPSGVQQGLIGRQQSVREVFPHGGGDHLPAQALLTALLAPARRVLLAGGEESGTWLVPAGAASGRTFAYALALTREAGPAPLGRLELVPGAAAGGLSPAAWFELLHHRHPFDGPAAPGWRLRLVWS